MSEELKLCPFCGAAPSVDKWSTKPPQFSINCPNCHDVAFLADSKRDVVDQWNRRANDARIKELSEQSKRLFAKLKDRESYIDACAGGKMKILQQRVKELEGLLKRALPKVVELKKQKCYSCGEYGAPVGKGDCGNTPCEKRTLIAEIQAALKEG